MEFKSPRSGLPGSLRETYTAIANSQDDVILMRVGDDGKGGLAQEGVGRWTRYRLPEMRNSPHTDSDSPHIGSKPNRVDQAYTAAGEQEETGA